MLLCECQFGRSLVVSPHVPVCCTPSLPPGMPPGPHALPGRAQQIKLLRTQDAPADLFLQTALDPLALLAQHQGSDDQQQQQSAPVHHQTDTQ